MSNYYGLNTPSSRDNNRLFEHESPERHSTMQQTPYLTFTPCTRLSRMTIDSQSNGVSGRTRPNVFQLPVTNFNERLMEAVKEEESSHPNLNMFLGSDKISIFDKKKNENSSSLFSEDEESDGGDLFSSSLCTMSSSPEAAPSIFNSKKHSIFDEDTEFEPIFPSTDHDLHYDPTNSWVFNIYQDEDADDEQTPVHNNQANNQNDDEDENRAPRIWRTRKLDNEQKQKKLTRSSSHQDNDTINQRLPLQEIRLEDYTSDDEPPARKKASVTTNENTHKIRFIRTLSPTRNAKRKGKETAENIMPI